MAQSLSKVIRLVPGVIRHVPGVIRRPDAGGSGGSPGFRRNSLLISTQSKSHRWLLVISSMTTPLTLYPRNKSRGYMLPPLRGWICGGTCLWIDILCAQHGVDILRA